MAQIGKNINYAAELLRKNHAVAIPTETVYGLAANALNEKAVLKIFEIKQRPFFDPLIVHLTSINEVDKYANWQDKRLYKLAEKFWPGPLTILLPKKEIIPDLVTSGLNCVAVRVPNHPLTLELLKRLDFPLAAPSANPFGYVSPTCSYHVDKQLGNKLDYILDGGVCSIGMESTIVGIEGSQLCIYRLGGLTLEEIEKICGETVLKINNSDNPKSPGQLKNHYSPKIPLITGNIKDLLISHQNKKLAVICFGEINYPEFKGTLLNLSPKKSLQEAALNLFDFLRRADESNAELVICDWVPDEGLGKAINDRLKRAASN